MKNINTTRLAGLILLFLLVSMVPQTGRAESDIALSDGQTVYVPVYSHVYSVNHKNTFLLTATLSIRNTDMQKSLTITAVDYYDDNGQLIQKYLDEPMTLSPLQSSYFVVDESDERGGVGANFIIKWKADERLNAPIVESVMIGTKLQQGISFVTRGVAIAAGE